MRYEGTVFRPPSEADSYILQATIGCSWNKCTYCLMYRGKEYRVRDLSESLEDLREASRLAGHAIQKIFVADGDALSLPMDHWRAILKCAREGFPALRQVSCYALAANLLEKSPEELRELRDNGLCVLYIGPESGDDLTLKRIAKGSTAAELVEVARRAHQAGMQVSAIALLGVGGLERSAEHAQATADLVTAMDPEYFAALTTSVLPSTPLFRLQEKGKFILPSIEQMLGELRVMIERARPTNALFRTNHASNYLVLAGQLPQDRDRLIATIDSALEGKIKLRPEWTRAL
jgi:radical SAM superfamily enzyme YgiQ (UPF0313 family)